MQYFSFKGKYASWRPGDNKEPVHVHITDRRYNSYGKFWISCSLHDVILESNKAFPESDLKKFALILVDYIPQVIDDWEESIRTSGLSELQYIDRGGKVNKIYYGKTS